MIDCPVCKNQLKLSRLKCGGCGVVLEGSFNLPRLARLNSEMRVLAEQMILCGGNLKDLAVEVGVSYPTLRRRVDDLIQALATLKDNDEKEVAHLLDEIGQGQLPAEEGIRKIREIQGEI